MKSRSDRVIALSTLSAALIVIVLIVATIAVGLTVFYGNNNNNSTSESNSSSTQTAGKSSLSSSISATNPSSSLSSFTTTSVSSSPTSMATATSTAISSHSSSDSTMSTTIVSSTSYQSSSYSSTSSLSSQTRSKSGSITTTTTSTATTGTDYSISQVNSTYRAGFEAFPYSHGGYLVREVSASWNVPRASCSSVLQGEMQYSSAWIGIEDGYNIEQVGVDVDCNGPSANYLAWYELFPAQTVILSSNINPGDMMQAKVSFSSYPTYTLTISDQRQGWTKTVSGSGGQNWQADFVIEAPDHASYPLTNFGSVTFSSCSMTIYSIENGQTFTGSILDHDYVSQITMVSSGSDPRILAAPTNLSNDGTSFAVNWENSD